jgi:hypothetical protein
MDLLVRVLAVAVPTAVTIAGLAILWYGLRLRERSRRLRRVGTVTLGRIVDNKVEAQGQGHVGFLPVVRFKPATGQPVTVTGRLRRAKAYATGTQLQVCYDPDEPARAEIVGQTGAGQYIIGGSVVAGFGVLLGLVAWAVVG